MPEGPVRYGQAVPGFGEPETQPRVSVAIGVTIRIPPGTIPPGIEAFGKWVRSIDPDAVIEVKPLS